MSVTNVSELPSADELSLLRESVRATLESLPGQVSDDGWSASWPLTWNALTAQGFWSTTEPPDGSLTAGVVIAEELGRALYPGPSCEVLTAASVLSRITGEHTMITQGVREAPLMFFATEDSLAPIDSAVIRLDPMVQAEDRAALVVATARDEIVVLSSLPEPSSAQPTLDVTRRTVEVSLDRAALPTVGPADPATASYGRTARALLYCADTLGAVEQVLARTAEYAKQRSTFGAPIGKYQAVAHRLVDHAVTARQMRLLLNAAVTAYDQNDPSAAHLAATAETFYWARSVDLVSDCIQLCGGIGFTWEFGHHFYLRRVAHNATLGAGRGRPARRLAEVAKW
ncbi:MULTISPECIES: acyl-CoA dehydrogenase [unclassified Mycobacterium]|uniref:acyl-CoA dehydrogenase n=1 Tax=unclassified Mycobacterium TaxID=2642494 RepID=UPI0029C92D77|nr:MULTISPECIES: acyl-CoA dehydrogenase [unclassified Mycobacterium]